MGLGIGKYCQRCEDQLYLDEGSNLAETLCNKCESIIKFDLQDTETKRKILEDGEIE